jgi:hypothetical protein
MRPQALLSSRALLAVLAATLGGVALAPASAQSPDGTAAFEACGRIADDAARHACLDEALRAAGMLEEEAPAAAPAPADSRGAPVAEAPSAAEADQPRLAPTPAAPARTAAAPPPPPSRRDREEREPDRQPYLTSIVTARLIGNHTLEIATPDAGRWVSTERQTFRRAPDGGDPMEILPAALGGYRCRLERSTIFPCRRVE